MEVYLLIMLSLFNLFLANNAANTNRFTINSSEDDEDNDDDLYKKINYILQQHSAKQQRPPLSSESASSVLKQSLQAYRNGVPHPKESKFWRPNYSNLGQVSGVTVDQRNNPIVLHRGSHLFDPSSFNMSHQYQRISEGPIQGAAILVLNSSTGDVITSFGKNRFYLPHGITMGTDGDIWVTDLALHQVMKLHPNSEEPLMVLGEAFIPGSDPQHFCKPTDVAVASTGEVFISDGYCNSRIQKYSAGGVLMAEWGHSGGRSIFAIPHSIALIEDQDMLCVADRENRRIQCFSAGLNPASSAGKFIYQVPTNQIGRVYGIEYGGDGLLYGVAIDRDATGFTVDLDSGEIIDTWRPEEGFANPHDLSTSPDGKSIFVGEMTPNRVIKFILQ